MPDSAQLVSALQRWFAGQASGAEVDALRDALAEGQITIVAGGEASFGDTFTIGEIRNAKAIAIGRGAKAVNIELSNLTAEAIELLRRLVQATPLPEYSPPALPERGTLSDAGKLPPGSRLPFRRNAVFTGREEELLELAECLLHAPRCRATAITQPAVVAGSGGIGKTQIAVEYGYRFGRFYQGVHWISVGDAALFDAEVAECGRAMRLQPWPEELPEQVERTLRAWQDAPFRLVVLDNLEKIEWLQEWLTRLGPVQVLITARRTSYPNEMGIQTIELSTLSRLESLALLGKLAPRLKNLPDAEINLLAERLGDFPLALHLAGCYFNLVTTMTPRNYLRDLDATSALDQLYRDEWKRSNPTRYKRNTLQVFLLSWEQLWPEKRIESLARRMLRIAGWCAANEPIPFDVMRKALGGEVGEVDFHVALSRLDQLGLISATPGGPRLHPLLAEFARVRDCSEAKSSLPGLAEALNDLAHEVNASGLPERGRPLLPHIGPAAEAMLDSDPEQAAALFGNLGSLLQAMGNLQGARAYLEQALAIYRQAMGEVHPNTAICLNNLGSLLQAMGDLAGARPYYEQALERQLWALGIKHPDTTRSLNNLGMLLQAMGDLVGARPYYEQALAINRQTLGEVHPNTATCLNNLGSLLQAMGDLAGARPYYEQALAIKRQAMGEVHPETAKGLNNLGILLQDMGNLAEARPYLEQALTIRRQVLGEKHYDTALSLNNLGALLQAMGNPVGARPYYEQALAIWREVLGEVHPNTATCLNNLGTLLQDMGDLAGARPYYEQALATRRQALGEAHPDTAASLNNLGTLLQDMGDLAGARPYFEQALAIAEVSLGSDHPTTCTFRGNLTALGRYNAATTYRSSSFLARLRSFFCRK